MMMPSAVVHALGMGEIEVHSALNEPLKAQIKLLSATASELSALKVALASDDAFRRMGIERTSALRDLRFEVVTQGAGAPYIKIASDTPVREPFLDLILMANWSNGQLMREYTLLLDPPVFDEGESVAPVMAAKTESAQIERGGEKPAAPAPAAKATTPPAPAPWEAPAGSYGPTKRADTLWAVAREMRPDSSVSIPRMMMALLKENPEAFVDANVNNLKAGYILRSPSREVINSISDSDAIAEANRQYQEWQVAGHPQRTQRQQVAAAAAPAGGGSASQAGSPPSAKAATAEGGARLKLLSPEEAQQQGGAGSSTQSRGTITEQLAIALETAEATKQENAELKTRLADLERQLQAVQRLLTLKGDTLGALQAGMGEQQPGVDQQQPQAGEAPVAAEAATGSEAATTEEAAPEVATAPAVSEAAPEANPEAAPQQPETKPEPAVQPEPVAETSLIDTIMGNPVLMAAAAGGPLLLLLLVMLIRRRRQQAELEEISRFNEIAATPDTDEEMPSSLASMSAGTADTKAADTDDFGGMIEGVGGGFGSSAGLGAIQTEESEIDPIAEADVYLAYRRYEQAEALLKEAIRNDSGRNELKLKLLEIYFTTKDKDAFEAQAEALYASLTGQDDDLWAQAVEMGREIAPDHPLFAEAGGTPPVSSDAATTVAGAGAAVAGIGAVANKLSQQSETSDFDDEFSFDLNDEELAESLNIPSQGDLGVESGDDLLDLDMPGTDADIMSSLDGPDMAASDELEELSPADDFSLDDNVASEDLLNLDDDFAAIGDGEEFDLGSLDKIEGDDALTDSFDFDDGLLGGGDLNEADGGLDELTAGLDLDQLDEQDVVGGSAESDNWAVEPAVSSFQTRDVQSETDDGYAPNLTDINEDVLGDESLDQLSLGDSEFDLGESEGNIFEGADDIVGTKLDLARAYIDMGDQNGARSILDEVVKEGDDSHRQEAEQLMRQIS